jgi:hypothetical protein
MPSARGGRPRLKKSRSVIHALPAITSAQVPVREPIGRQITSLTLTRLRTNIEHPSFRTVERGMSGTAQISVVERIREQIQRLEGGSARSRTVLPFGVEAVDSRLPGGGLAVGALHCSRSQ